VEEVVGKAVVVIDQKEQVTPKGYPAQLDPGQVKSLFRSLFYDDVPGR
jgi:hypothetical protein